MPHDAQSVRMGRHNVRSKGLPTWQRVEFLDFALEAENSLVAVVSLDGMYLCCNAVHRALDEHDAVHNPTGRISPT
jgi:hypothetical protein